MFAFSIVDGIKLVNRLHHIRCVNRKRWFSVSLSLRVLAKRNIVASIPSYFLNGVQDYLLYNQSKKAFITAILRDTVVWELPIVLRWEVYLKITCWSMLAQ